jgi:hypothetical protein
MYRSARMNGNKLGLGYHWSFSRYKANVLQTFAGDVTNNPTAPVAGQLHPAPVSAIGTRRVKSSSLASSTLVKSPAGWTGGS